MSRSYFKSRFCCLLVAGIVAMGTAQAQEGEFNLEPMTGGLEPKVNINFGPAMMAGFAETVASSNPDLSTVLGGIQGLRLMVFEDLSDSRPLASQIEASVNELIDSGWNRAIQVRENGEQVDVFMIETDQFVTGMVLMVRESSDSAVLANIHGEMDPVLVGRLIGSGKILDGFDFDDMFDNGNSD